VDLQSLFPDPVLEQRSLHPELPDRFAHVWRVRTAAEDVVVRTTLLRGRPPDPPDGQFFWGCHHLFGIDPRRVSALAPLNRLLGEVSPVPVPRVLRTAALDGREYAVLERLPGARLDSFLGQPPGLLEELGRCLAALHGRAFDRCGAPVGEVGYALAAFNDRLVATLRAFVPRFYADDARIAAALDAVCRRAAALPPPRRAALVMVDVDPTQYLADDGRLTGLVDTEAYVLAPPELELVALEYVLDAPAAAAFRRGYGSVAPLPELAAVRTVYRYLCRLLCIQGQDDLDAWLARPAYLDG
jgi:hypothetical protein